MENKKFEGIIKVKSLKLLKMLSRQKLLGYMLFVGFDKTDNNYPVWGFIKKPQVLEVVNEFLDTYGYDNRSMDTSEWELFNADKSLDWKNEKIIKTRNKHILNDIIDAGYGTFLVKVKKNKMNQKYYYFLFHEDIAQLKSEGDYLSQCLYNEKIKEK